MRRFFLSSLLLWGANTFAHAEDSSHNGCVPVAKAQKAADEDGGRWIPLKPDAYHFAQGIYAIDPDVPAGLPFGDNAVVVKFDNGSGIIIFIDGDKACTPIIASKELIALLKDVTNGKVTHAPTDGEYSSKDGNKSEDGGL